MQEQLEEAVKGMTWEQRESYLSNVASIYLAELSDDYTYPLDDYTYPSDNCDNALDETLYLKNHPYTNEGI